LPDFFASDFFPDLVYVAVRDSAVATDFKDERGVGTDVDRVDREVVPIVVLAGDAFGQFRFSSLAAWPLSSKYIVSPVFMALIRTFAMLGITDS
jgi:hypothetical protein